MNHVSDAILADIARVGARHAAVGVECNFTEDLQRRLVAGEIMLSEAAEEVRKQASWYTSAGWSLARLAGRLRAHANRQERK